MMQIPSIDQFFQVQQKYKILAIADHYLATSGVACQGKYLSFGLINTGKYTIRQLGAAMKHADYNIAQPHPDLVIKPIDGFGSPELIRQLLIQERPDALFLFTDPRFFMHIFEMEDEIHQICPIVYWNIWDHALLPPTFNKPLYDSCDLLNCINYPTYGFLKEWFPERTHYVPHAIPDEVFYPLPKQEAQAFRRQLIPGVKDDTFIGLFVSRNARRKQPSDLMLSWKMFLEELEKKHGHKNAVLVMHCDPFDQEGPNLLAVLDVLGLQNHVLFSKDRVGFEDMNRLYNCADFVVNISNAEGFGLSTLEGMYCGKPVIAPKTGGQERQVVDYRDGSENGIALNVDHRTLVGSQLVPYIYEDHYKHEQIRDAFMKMYEMGPEGREALGNKARDYARSEYNVKNMVDTWDRTLEETIKNWRQRYTRKVCITL